MNFNNFLENFVLPETMSPIDKQFLIELPPFLLFGHEEQLQSLQYPWELLTFLLMRTGELLKASPQERSNLAITPVTTVTLCDTCQSGIEVPACTIEHSTIGDSVIVEPYAVIQNSIIGRGSRIKPFSFIKDSILGKNVTVDTGSRITASCLCHDVRTGFNTEINHSVLGSGSQAHKSNLENVIVCVGVTFGHGSRVLNTTTDNATVKSVINGAKIDTGLPHYGGAIGSGVFLGDSVVVMPGVHIGKYSRVFSGVTLQENVSDETEVLFSEESQQKLTFRTIE